MQLQLQISSFPFKEWLRKDKENKFLFLWSGIIIVLQFSIFKILYPYPNFMPPDSNSYMEVAWDNQFINIWAIGYSKFLRLVSSFSNSHIALVVFQYLILQFSLLFFLFTIRYLLSPGKVLFRTLLAVSVLNPLLAHIANFVSSDCLFTALSLIWFTQLLWIIQNPTKKLLMLHSIILLLAFSVRYNALYYPFISIILIICSKTTTRIKYFSTSAIVVLLLVFIGRTQYEYYIKTNTIQYSAFGGWQLAANALYGYAYSLQDDPATVPSRYKKLHILVNRHIDSLRNLPIRPDQGVGVYYLWDFKSPLRVYMEQKWEKEKNTDFFKQWASMAPLYAKYGTFLISKHPWGFAKNYVWPNLKRYYAPPALFMGMYNLGNSRVDSIAVKWFGWKDNKLITHTRTRIIHVANVFTIITPIFNLVFVLGVLAFTGLAGFKKCNSKHKKLIVCTLTVWLCNTFFSVLSAPIELRYQLFPLIISLVWGMCFISYVMQEIYNTETKYLVKTM